MRFCETRFTESKDNCVRKALRVYRLNAFWLSVCVLRQCDAHSQRQHPVQRRVRARAAHLVLPGIQQVTYPDETARSNPGTIAHTHRLRELSVQAMAEGSARARLGRAMNTRTTASAQSINLQVGEKVDFYREPTQKDTSGWLGPAIVADASRATRGIISVRWQGRVLEVQLQHVRRHLHYFHCWRRNNPTQQPTLQYIPTFGHTSRQHLAD